MKRISIFSIALTILVFSSASFAQRPALTAADYDRAAKMLGFGTAPFVDRAGVRPTFLPDGRFWYSVLTATGREFVMINPVDGSRQTGATAAAIGVTAPAGPGGPGGRFGGGGATSPDGKKSVFIKDWNLWVKDIPTGKDTQLTTDGVKDFGYATDNAGWKHSDRAIVLWSPDSKKVATFQQDQRHVSDMYLASTAVGAGKLEAWKYPLPTDKEIAKLHRVVIDIETGKMVRF